MNCRYCRAPLMPGRDLVECEDKRACSKRVAKRLAPQLGRMVTKPYVGGFDPVKAYNEAPKGDA